MRGRYIDDKRASIEQKRCFEILDRRLHIAVDEYRFRRRNERRKAMQIDQRTARRNDDITFGLKIIRHVRRTDCIAQDLPDVRTRGTQRLQTKLPFAPGPKRFEQFVARCAPIGLERART